MFNNTCKFCSKQFQSIKITQKYCSRACFHNTIGFSVILTCITCKKEFSCKNSRVQRTGKNPLYCSQKCWTDNITGKSRCLNCKKEFTFKKSIRPGVFCEKICEKNHRKDPQIRFTRAKKYFESHVIKHESSCWEWIGNLRKGYGAMFFNKSMGAHKFSYILHKGEVPKGYLVCHHCDTPTCTNPEHLFLGTPKDNMHDMIKKGRNKTTIGVNNNTSRNEETVKQIKIMIKEGKKDQEIAKHLNENRRWINNVRHNKAWKHITID